MSNTLLEFLTGGIAGLGWWGMLAVLLVVTQLTIFAVTLYLHRSQAHRGVDFHPLISHFFRFWVWLTTSMITREWVAIHRKHHAKVETDEDPHSPVSKGIRTVFWRIMLFYIGAIIIIGFLLPYSDPSLLAAASNEDVTASPFTLVFERAGIAVAASVMNAVILTAILSAGNSGLYASTRMLYAMAKEGTAPRLFARLNERGVPVMALLATAVIGLFGFLSEVMGDGGAYTWLINVSGLSGFIVWVGISWSHFRFRRAYIRQGQNLEDLPYRAPLFPIGPIIALAMLVIVIIGQNVQAIVEGRVVEVASAYIGLPAFLLLWSIHRLVTGRRSRVVGLEEMDVAGLELRP